jgi:hypothetical protein
VKSAQHEKVVRRRPPPAAPAVSAVGRVPAAQVAIPAGDPSDAYPLSGTEMALSLLVAASVLLLAVASLPLRIWLRYGPEVLWHVARLRGPLAVVGAAIPLGIGIGYLVVLLHLT